MQRFVVVVVVLMVCGLVGIAFADGGGALEGIFGDNVAQGNQQGAQAGQAQGQPAAPAAAQPAEGQGQGAPAQQSGEADGGQQEGDKKQGGQQEGQDPGERVQSLREIAEALEKELAAVKQEIEGDADHVRSELATLKQDVASLKTRRDQVRKLVDQYLDAKRTAVQNANRALDTTEAAVSETPPAGGGSGGSGESR